MAVKWKNHIMWTPTIPQEKKFSTVSYYKTSRSMFKPITVQKILQTLHGVLKTEEDKIYIFSTNDK